MVQNAVRSTEFESAASFVVSDDFLDFQDLKVAKGSRYLFVIVLISI